MISRAAASRRCTALWSSICHRSRDSHCRVSQSLSSSVSSLDADEVFGDKALETISEGSPLLLALQNVRLRYPENSTAVSSTATPASTESFNLRIHHPQNGGHVLLGPNGSGKSLISQALVSQGHTDYIHAGKFITDPNVKFFPSRSISHVSFESHESLLQEGLLTAYKAITGGSGNLNKAAQFLIVRFGLFPLLHRNVDTLSTGEIRKVLLVRALSNRPRLLILDNAFDGLDVASRESLSDLVSKTLQGFRPDILVQGVDSKATAHTQVLLMTHRAEEIVPEISTVHHWTKNMFLETSLRLDRTGDELLLSDEFDNMVDDRETNTVSTLQLLQKAWNDPTLPTKDQVAEWWNVGRPTPTHPSSNNALVHAKNLSVQRGDATLLDDINWNVKLGQRWLVAGGNGAGKSTLSRLLALEEEHGGDSSGFLQVSTSSKPRAVAERRHGVGWVSTELHMRLARSNQTARQVLQGANEEDVPDVIAHTVARWLRVDDVAILSRPFAKLSQGQQKLILIATALASRPKLLVLDEPCQGLDYMNRRKVLGLVERICQATDVGLVYITHHLEELLPSVQHVLHVHDGRVVYNGSVQKYDADSLI